MRILLTGRNGQVGSELVRSLAPFGEVHATGRADLDLADADALVAAVRALRPGLIVNAAAYTEVDRAESDPDAALAVNARAPRVLAEEAARLGAPIIHYSTDYVFDGEKEGPYLEEDAPGPLSVYGRSKLLGEEGVRAAGGPHLILRVAWVYGGRRRNFLTTMLELFTRRVEVAVVNDQTGSPSWCREIAGATAEIILRATKADSGLHDALTEWGGTYHLPSSGHTTWYGFAEKIAEHLRRTDDRSLRLERLQPISSDEYRVTARRPRNSLLCGERVEERFGVTLPPWQEQVVGCIDALTSRREVLVG